MRKLWLSIIFTLSAQRRLGAGVNVKDFGPMAPCSKLCRGCVIAALFHFDATNEGSPRAQCVYYKVPSGSATLPPHQTGTCAAVFSVHVSAVLCCAQGGSRLYRFALGFRKGDDPVTVEGLAPDACREEFVGAGTDVFL